MASAGSSHSMNILFDVERRIELHNPVDLRNIQTPGSHIGTEKYALLKLPKFIESGRSFGLLLLAVDVHNTNVDVIEKVRVKFNAVAR